MKASLSLKNHLHHSIGTNTPSSEELRAEIGNALATETKMIRLLCKQIIDSGLLNQRTKIGNSILSITVKGSRQQVERILENFPMLMLQGDDEQVKKSPRRKQTTTVEA